MPGSCGSPESRCYRCDVRGSVGSHRLDDRRILRYDLTLPLLLTVHYDGQPLRIWAAGKAYRVCQVDATHLEAFHQAEVFWLDERGQLDPWQMTGRVFQSADRVLPGRTVKIVPTEYPMCSQAWQLEVDDDGHWFEVLAWGIFTDRIVKYLGGDPTRHIGRFSAFRRIAKQQPCGPSRNQVRSAEVPALTRRRCENFRGADETFTYTDTCLR